MPREPIWNADPELKAEAEVEQKKHRQQNGPDHDAPLPLDITVASTLAGQRPKEREWIVPGWIPSRQVTLLSGHGEVGKTILALQAMIAIASGTLWVGLQTVKHTVFGLFAEEDGDELFRRVHAIAAALGIDLATLDNMIWHSAVIDACELIEIDHEGRVVPTQYFERLRLTVTLAGARVLILDAATNLYGGDELRRREVNQFLVLLRRLAIEIDGAVILLTHPSNSGMATDTGLSGSNHWHNAVRSRLYFKKATEDDKDADPKERLLRVMKANYAESGLAVRLRWSDGAFLAIEPPSGVDRIADSAKADRVFLALLRETYASEFWVSSTLAARNYAPKVFARHERREQLNADTFEAAMLRLLNSSHLVKNEEYGKASNRHTRLAPSEQG